ncbi:MAG: GNAT family N-acetyltransferase [Alphaproteobacteria bacterium]
MTASITLTSACDDVDWTRLAAIMRDAPLFDRPAALWEAAFRASYTCVFAWDGPHLVGAARATSDGVFYATIFDVAVTPERQGEGIGRMLVEHLLAVLPVERVFLTHTAGKAGFYARMGFLRQTNAMGHYGGEALDTAVSRGVLVPVRDEPAAA